MRLSVVKYLFFELIRSFVDQFIDKLFIIVLIETGICFNLRCGVGNRIKTNIELFFELIKLVVLIDIPEISDY